MGRVKTMKTVQVLHPFHYQVYPIEATWTKRNYKDF